MEVKWSFPTTATKSCFSWPEGPLTTENSFFFFFLIGYTTRSVAFPTLNSLKCTVQCLSIRQLTPLCISKQCTSMLPLLSAVGGHRSFCLQKRHYLECHVISRITQSLSFCYCPAAFGMMPSRFICAVMSLRISFILKIQRKNFMDIVHFI